MTESPNNQPLDNYQRILLFVFAFLFAIILFFLRVGISSQAPFDQLARRSLDPDIALANGRPTIFEFYADWCEACREMAPAILSIEEKNNNQFDLVLLNIDNQRWEDLLIQYQVIGIPQLNFFDKNGEPVGNSIGLRDEEELEVVIDSIIQENPIPSFGGVRKSSNLKDLN